MNECECRVGAILVDDFKVGSYTIVYCPKHAAVDYLLEVLNLSYDILTNALEADDWDFVDSVVWKIENAIALATKENE